MPFHKTARFRHSNSNGRIVTPPGLSASSSVGSTAVNSASLGLTSQRARPRIVERLREQGITNEKVLEAMLAVPRHLFVDEGLASHAYDDAALPIGFGQTISQPYVVARMVSAICEPDVPGKILEIG